MKKLVPLTFFLFSFVHQTLSQVNNKNVILKVAPGSPGMWPSIIEFNADKGPTFINGQAVMINGDGKLTPINEVTLINSGTDKIGQKHYRYQQTYRGMPVENAIMAVHVKNGKIVRENGFFIKNFPSRLSLITTSKIIDQNKALQYALVFADAKKYAWQDAHQEQLIKKIKQDPAATNFPKAELVWYNGEKSYLDTSLQLAYRFDIFAISPLGRQFIYIDAITGKLLGKENLISKLDVPGKANTGYSGVQNIISNYDKNSKDYILVDSGRSVFTYNMESDAVYLNTNFRDKDNNWFDKSDSVKVGSIDRYGADAHWGAEMTYDFYKNKFNRIGLDGKGQSLFGYVNANIIPFGYRNNANAFWDGNSVTFGIGNQNTGPITSLDIVGHEFTHGVTQSSSNLKNEDKLESGALNEGFSDIFGTLIEFENKRNANWTIGEECGYYDLDPRNAINPLRVNHPSCYRGYQWNLNGDAHKNSTVLFRWFYILSEGEFGSNERGDQYNVIGIGKEKAGIIAYNTNVFHLNKLSNFLDVRNESIAVAEALYGKGSNEATQTINAWTAVGLKYATCTTPDVDLGNYFTRVLGDMVKPNEVNPNALVNTTPGDYYFSWYVNNTGPYPGFTYVINSLGSKQYELDVLSKRGNCDTFLNFNLVTYCRPGGTTKSRYYIDRFFMGQLNLKQNVSNILIDNQSDDNNGFLDYSNKATISLSKSTPNFRITISPSPYQFPDSIYYQVWIDYDHNGVFENMDALGLNEQIILNGVSKGSISRDIILPNNALDGITRMRVSMKSGKFSTPCEVNTNSNSFIGEVEDYQVNIIPKQLVTFPRFSMQGVNEGNGNIINDAKLQALIYPNPFSEKTILKILTSTIKNNYTLVISDIYGRRVKQINNITSSGIEINRENLTPGIYQYQLLEEKNISTTGKIVIQ